METKHKVTTGRYRKLWAVFIDGIPVFADLAQSELPYYKQLATKNIEVLLNV